MHKERGKILWIDDEIEHLKPHILFLEEKGYQISTSNSGQNGVEKSKEQIFDLVLLDQFMPGIDGIEVLKEIKEENPTLPVIMITKSDEEWLMDEAISERIEHFLIKPVNPSQIFIVCKQVLENTIIKSDKAISGYLKEFQQIEIDIDNCHTFDDWWQIYTRLIKWESKLEDQKEESLVQILDEQFQSCNHKFTKFIEQEYPNWLFDKDRPTLSNDIVSKVVKPILDNNEKVCLVVMDAMRLDQFMSLYPILAEDFKIKIKPSVSLLPSATPFSRNAIFSGLFPDQFCKKYPEQLDAMKLDKGSLNHFESQFLTDQLKRYNLSNITHHYHKIWMVDEGKHFLSKLDKYLKNDLIAIVVNFVDQLAHRRSESDVLKEMLPDEISYKKAVTAWYEKSWIRTVLSNLGSSGYKIVMTSDHGSIMVNKSTIVSADRNASSGVRYKHGRNINASKKHSIDVRDLSKFRLPEIGYQTNYLLSKDDYYYLYPNEQNKYKIKLKGSFQHGGVSMQEMMVPIMVMDPK
jgi:DNA-binding response OmpR family regulator|tara:strand:+ start:1883 stop:3439 length:1557 start_codon:yes stop_codon:yes gene_type:complete